MSYRGSGSSRGSGYRSENDQGSVFDGGSAGGPSLQIIIGLALLVGLLMFGGFIFAANSRGGVPATPPVAAQPTATAAAQPTAAPTAAPAPPPAAGGSGSAIETGTPDVTIDLLPEPLALAFADTELTAPANALVTLNFNNQNDLGVQHNWVLVDGSTSVADTVNTAAIANATELFVPPAGTEGGLAWTAMLSVGETGSVTFRAPADPGTYLYICTFPGHYLGGMVGDFVVE